MNVGGDAAGGGGGGGGGADAAAGGANPNVVPETPNPHQSSVGNGGGNALTQTQLLQILASQGEQLVSQGQRFDENLRQNREDQKQRDKERAEQAKTNAEQAKMNAEQTKMNESLVKKNEEQDGVSQELMRQMIASNKRLSTVEDRCDKNERGIDDLRTGQAEQSRKEAEQDIEIARTAKKAAKNAKMIKEGLRGLRALGWEPMDLSSPESAATNDGEVGK